MNCKFRQLLWLVSLCPLLMPLTGIAQTSLVMERASITIQSPPPSPNEKSAKTPHAPLTYDIELRPEDALRLEYIHTLNTLTEGTGVLINFTAPTIVALPAMKVYTPVDVLFIAEDGTILQILPNIVLGEITKTIQARTPVQAFLFLKAGEVAARGIHPRDTVAGSMFAAAPAIQE